MKKIFFALFFSLIFCSPVFANSGFYNTKIAAITVHDNWNVLIIELKSPVATGENCGISNAVILRKDHYMFKEMYAALLSAFHAQTVISGWANGCFGQYPVITRLDLRK
ncbi:hypothetical protein C7G91_08665 [Acinetobacter nosocomialis]|uniref:hypothetical protein n=1 Tax=Acinetobacter nosocomialis TaxID=106654 RepID=UPI000D0B9CDC|nr:hypothetical protein [Acinetobacter nosocomialis]PSE43613.1 hypothetical protein C7G97_13340 [Acinetobacter nosocomialis]PSE83684.1 hypothetical protein C7G91_08665 [Acinetobacter nosocomialis]